MRKLMIVALMAVAASTAFAGDSDALKAILKAKTYADAEALLKSSLNALQGAEEKAKAYNKLVDLAMEKVVKEQATMAGNQMAEQMGQGKVEAYDTVGFYKALDNAYTAAFECETYDQQPNAKGKVKPKFHKANQDRLFPLRANLVNAGIYAQEQNDMKNAYKYLAEYVDTYNAPLFADMDKGQDENLTNIAYYAAIFAYQNKDYANVDKYADIALKDPEKSQDAMNLKLAVASESLKTKADSVAYAQKLEGIYAQNPDNELVFGQLVSIYNDLKMTDKRDQLFNQKLATDPNNFSVWAVRGQNALSESNYEEAANAFKKCIITQPDNPTILTLLGACLIDRASQAEDKAAGKTGRVAPQAMEQIKPLYEEALTYLEKAKSLDPNKEKSSWAYPLYRCYYQLYGENDSRTKAAESY